MEEKDPTFIIAIPKRRQYGKAANVPKNKGNKSKISETQLIYNDVPSRKHNTLWNDKTLLFHKMILKNTKYRTKGHCCKFKKITEIDKDDEVEQDNGLIKSLHSHTNVFKSFKVEINNVLRLRHTIGIKNDCILNIEKDIKHEMDVYNKSSLRCKANSLYFRTYISEDYSESVDLLNKSTELNLKLDEQLIELYNLANEQCSITSKIISFYYKYRTHQMYGRFLWYLSPVTWRAVNRDFARSVDIEYLGFTLGHDDDGQDDFHELYDVIKKEFSGSTPTQAVLYFKKPEDLVGIFERSEQHYAYDFTQLMRLTEFANQLQTGIQTMKNSMAAQCTEVVNTVRNFKKAVDFLESRCVDLETRFYKILNGAFSKLIGSKEVLELQIHLTYCYEKISGDDSDGRDIFHLAKYLESAYMRYNKSFDSMQDQSMKQLIQQCMKGDRIAMRKAIVAQKELKRAKHMEQSLYRIMMPSHKTIVTTTNSESKISTHSVISKEQNKSQQMDKTPAITEEELEYLTLFTDWLEGENPEKYLSNMFDM